MTPHRAHILNTVHVSQSRHLHMWHLWHLWHMNCGSFDMCPVVFKQGSAAYHNCAFLGTCPETSAPPVALPDMTADKTQYALCTHPGSPFQESGVSPAGTLPLHTRGETCGDCCIPSMTSSVPAAPQRQESSHIKLQHLFNHLTLIWHQTVF